MLFCFCHIKHLVSQYQLVLNFKNKENNNKNSIFAKHLRLMWNKFWVSSMKWDFVICLHLLFKCRNFQLERFSFSILYTQKEMEKKRKKKMKKKTKRNNTREKRHRTTQHFSYITILAYKICTSNWVCERSWKIVLRFK